eukprot:CAMPEP_0115860712 /NCGR_PEP_ID=MMETSP0287-20121206/17270_1 /TAXON_ID=412157 /ORGANISM="Chrysochromulina rotalis, Strain UIO044" /LENGTH=49 /DNA_ID=CAMNT_0003315047 /DNA_START=415 /DNA_END=564 /DNA_ORIENTATION=+
MKQDVASKVGLLQIASDLYQQLDACQLPLLWDAIAKLHCPHCWTVAVTV